MAGLPLRYLKQVFKACILKHIDLTRLGTESGAADFSRFAHATDPTTTTTTATTATTTATMTTTMPR